MAVFLTLQTMLCALIPFVGPAIVWVPVCIYLAVYVCYYWLQGYSRYGNSWLLVR